MSHPLTEDHKRLIDESLKGLKVNKEVIERAKQAGLDMTDLEQRSDEVEAKLLGIRRAFFPG